MTAWQVAAIVAAIPVIYLVLLVRKRRRLLWALEFLHVDLVKGFILERAGEWERRDEFLADTVEQYKELLKIRGLRECEAFILAHATGDDQVFLLKAIRDFWSDPEHETPDVEFSYRRSFASFVPESDPIEKNGAKFRLFKPRWKWIDDLYDMNRAVNILNED
jgi:hypothetical protein